MVWVQVWFQVKFGSDLRIKLVQVDLDAGWVKVVSGRFLLGVQIKFGSGINWISLLFGQLIFQLSQFVFGMSLISYMPT